MAKEEGAKTVVYGGQKTIPQQYCGTVGGQSTDFSTIDSEVKTSGLKNNSLAPPDFTTNSVQGITWRLGFGIFDPTQPEGESTSNHLDASFLHHFFSPFLFIFTLFLAQKAATCAKH